MWIGAPRKWAKLLQTACTTLIPLCLLGCFQSEDQHSNLKDLERSVIAFYDSMSLSDELRVRGISGGIAIEGFCVLSAYEDRVTSESNKIIAANAFLEKHQLMGKEEYWHLIVKTANGIQLARFSSSQAPLISPRPTYDGANCAAARSIVFSKVLDPTGMMPLIGKISHTTIRINIQPGD